MARGRLPRLMLQRISPQTSAAWIVTCWTLQLSMCLATLPAHAQAADGWVQTLHRRPFEIRSEFALDQYPGLIQECAKLNTALGRTLELPIGNRPIQINLFRNKHSYLHHLKRRVPEGIHRRALFVQGPDRGRLYAYRSSSLLMDVRHETTHALIHNTLPYVPLWLDEGLAGHFEISADRQRWGHRHLQRLRWNALLGWRPNLKQLESQRDQARFPAAAYRESWAWVHFLLHESQDSRRALIDYVQQIHKRQQPGPMSVWLQKRVPQAEIRLLAHIRRRPAPPR